MQHDPRGTPPAPIEPTGFFTGIQFRPIIAGIVLDTLATIVLVTAYLLLGSLGTMIGGFYAAYIAGAL